MSVPTTRSDRLRLQSLNTEHELRSCRPKQTFLWLNRREFSLWKEKVSTFSCWLLSTPSLEVLVQSKPCAFVPGTNLNLTTKREYVSNEVAGNYHWKHYHCYLRLRLNSVTARKTMTNRRTGIVFPLALLNHPVVSRIARVLLPPLDEMTSECLNECKWRRRKHQHRKVAAGENRKQLLRLFWMFVLGLFIFGISRLVFIEGFY